MSTVHFSTIVFLYRSHGLTAKRTHIFDDRGGSGMVTSIIFGIRDWCHQISKFILTFVFFSFSLVFSLIFFLISTSDPEELPLVWVFFAFPFARAFCTPFISFHFCLNTNEHDWNHQWPAPLHFRLPPSSLLQFYLFYQFCLLTGWIFWHRQKMKIHYLVVVQHCSKTTTKISVALFLLLLLFLTLTRLVKYNALLRFSFSV